jgi:hypothetical protein
MASVATLTAFNAPFGIDMTLSRYELHGKLAFAAGTYAAGGVLPVYTTIKDASGQAVLLGTLNVNPDNMLVFSNSGSGFTYVYVQSTGKVKILTGSAAQSPGTELANGALPAGVTGDSIKFIASWVKQ